MSLLLTALAIADFNVLRKIFAAFLGLISKIATASDAILPGSNLANWEAFSGDMRTFLVIACTSIFYCSKFPFVLLFMLIICHLFFSGIAGITFIPVRKSCISPDTSSAAE
jgi:hypothetical protein